MYNLTLVIPAKNEELSLPKVLVELKKYRLNAIIVVNTINPTIKRLKQKFNYKIFRQKKVGYGNAIVEGIKKVKTKNLCIFNADGSFDPKYIQKMMRLIEKKKDFVFASRYKKGGGSDDDTLLTFIGNKFFTFLGNFFFNVKISDILFTYTIGKTNSFKKLKLISNDFRLCVEIPLKIVKKDMSYDDMAVYERKRMAGKKNVNEFKDGFLILSYLVKAFFVKMFKK